ncbi:transposase [Microbacterium paulum]
MRTELKTTTETVDLRTGEVLSSPPNITAVAERAFVAAAHDHRTDWPEERAADGTDPAGPAVRAFQRGKRSLTEHLGYDPGHRVGKQTPNSRNGSTPKTVRTEIGDLTIQVPEEPGGHVRAGGGAQASAPRIAGFDEAVSVAVCEGHDHRRYRQAPL